MKDAIVIGAGIAGLATALRLAEGGADVTLVTKGIGGLQLSQGSLDILGYTPQRVTNPLEAIPDHIQAHPNHPYRHFTNDEVAQAASWMRDLLGPDYLVGEPTRNYLLPTAVGALRPTAIAQPSMVAGEPAAGKRFAIVGLTRLKDFSAPLVAANLSRQKNPDGSTIEARALAVDLQIRDGEVDTSGVNHARAFDTECARKALVDALKPMLKDGEIVGLPAVLGLNDIHAWRDIAQRLGHEVFEIALQPPSVPGMRLNQALTQLAKERTRFIMGTAVVGHDSADGRITSLTINTAGRPKTITARNIVLAAGGFESGALSVDSYLNVRDTVLDLPIVGVDGPLFHNEFWGEEQPLFLSGFNVDKHMRVLTENLTPAYSNVYAVGGNQAGATRWREKSGEGIALATALRAADSILEEIR